MIDKPQDALTRLREAVTGHKDTCKHIELMVEMVEGSPLYVTLKSEEGKSLEAFDVLHPKEWGEMEIDGECFKNIQIVFAILRAVLRGLGKSGKRIANNSRMYGWTYEIT